MKGRRIDMSATQVIASMLAAVTGALAASDLGIAGTVIGAAVMSVASTAGAAVYKHYIGRSRERLKAAAEAARVSPLAGGSAGAALLGRQRATQPGRHSPQAAGEGRAARERETAGTDSEQTQLLPVAGYSRRGWHDADRANGFDERVRRDDEATRTIGTRYRPDWPDDPADHGTTGTVGLRYGGPGEDGATSTLGGRYGGPGEDGATSTLGGRYGGPGTSTRGGRYGHPGGTPGGDDGSDGTRAPDDRSQRRRPRPLLLAGIALGAFLLAMGGITIVEAASGKPLDALLWGKHGSGTTVQNIVTGHGSRAASARAHPAVSPSVTAPSAPASPSPAASAHASPSPTPSPTSPGPTPGPTPTPSSSAGSKSPGTGAPQSPSAGAG